MLLMLSMYHKYEQRRMVSKCMIVATLCKGQSPDLVTVHKGQNSRALLRLFLTLKCEICISSG